MQVIRNIANALLAAAAVCVAAPAAAAGDYPSKPIRIVVPYAPGGGSDVLARIIGEGLPREWGQPVVIENKPGASGTTASEAVSRAAPDGYTLVMGTSASHSVNTVVFAETYDPLTAFAPVALVTLTPNVLFTSPALEVKSIDQLVQYMKDNKGSALAIGGPATSGRFAAELFQSELGVELTLVPYGGSTPAVTDVRAGHVKVGITDVLAPSPFIKNGDLRAIAVTSMERVKSMPDVPTLNETVAPGFDAVAWNAMFAPPGTPAAVIDKLNAGIRKVMSQPEVKQKVESMGQQLAVGSPEDLAKFMQQDIAKWKGVAQSNQLKF